MDYEPKGRRPDLTPGELLTTKEAARLLALSHRTLEEWRLRGGGPHYSKLGRAVRYARTDIAEWLLQLRCANTGGPLTA
jgi:excisionase family DNA binding protein